MATIQNGFKKARIHSDDNIPEVLEGDQAEQMEVSDISYGEDTENGGNCN